MSQTTVESTANDVGAYAGGFKRSSVRPTAHTLGLPSLQGRRVEQIRDVKSEMISRPRRSAAECPARRLVPVRAAM